jgi:AcrR family transcriptional regulator
VPRISEEQRARRREQILDAARMAFADNGFHETSMDDIIDAAGMSAGGVYRYFPSKAAIISAIAEGVVARVTAGLESVLAEEPTPPLAEVLGGMLRVIDGLADGEGKLALAVWAEAQREPAVAELAAAQVSRIRAAVRDVVRRAADDGQVRLDIDLDALGSLLFSLGPGYLVKRRLLPDVDVEREIEALGILLSER